MDLGRIGVWDSSFTYMPADRLREVVPEIESLGFRAMWYPEYLARESLMTAALILAAGETSIAAPGIAVLWARDATAMSNAGMTLAEAYPERFVLGIGVSHYPAVTSRGWDYKRPYSAMVEYVAALEASRYIGPPPVAPPPLVLAALGPKMLRLAAEHAAGAHPYFVPPEHTAEARRILGPDKLLAPEQAVVLASDPDEARAIARRHAAIYLSLPNYRNNLKRLGWADEDMNDGGTDAVIDAIIAWGGPDEILERVAEHLDAGADHVGVQVLNGPISEFPLAEWREIAPVLGDL